ncbi:Fibrinogen C domain-containing protein 1 [Amphibalanus amphitrite]|uniref:Fibrinogen C domain-containing protein 1 n=1 Tax=Amphibalanus amphitrite TaxID=1232801 RepID=A0A6A4W5J7_AMPAM|nr:Fibrinogen C domain-containing protein 1 [Amphibalanus amphitrite]
MCHGCQVVRVSAVVLLALSLGIVNCDYSEAEQFAPAQTAAKTEAHTISDYFMDDVDISYFTQTNIHDLYNAITEQHSKTNELSDLPAGARSGVHLLQTGLAGPQKVAALCDLDADGGRWTVIQRRDDIEPRENFYRNWTAYRAGFGRLDGEFWWGLDKMSALTAATDRSYELRVNLEDFEGRRRHALYGQFSIAPESDGFRLHVSNYSGDAGDSLSTHSGQRFTTYDRDHDPYAGNCARSHRGGWWYHEKCLQSNLNGVYFKKYRADNTRGITWTTFHNSFYSLKTVTMKIRPT